MSEQNTGNLANLYRPKTFKEVVGQDLAVSALKRIAHADGISVRSVLLIGSWGSGKTTTARIFGRALNCEHFKENDDVCNECPKCKDAMTKTSQLYMELDATSVGNVEAIRNISERLSIVPNGRRLVVVDEIHAASSAALNALLKLIEDGVPNTMFMFCLAQGTLIPTSKGVKPIEEIKEGDFVYSLNGMKRVKALHVNGIKECVVLKTKSGHTLTATPDHKIQVLRDGAIVWSEIKDVKVTDSIPISSTPVMPSGLNDLTLSECELLGRIVGDGYYNDYHLGVLFNYSEWDYGQELLKRAGVSYTPNYRESVVEVTILESGKLKKVWGLDDYVNGEKQMPTSVWTMSSEQVSRFLGGWRDADMSKGNKCLHVKSKTLAKQASILAMYSGETVSVRRRKRVISEDSKSCGVKKGTYFYTEVRKNSNRVVPFDKTLAELILSNPPKIDWKIDTKIVDGLTKLRQRLQNKYNYNVSWDYLKGVVS